MDTFESSLQHWPLTYLLHITPVAPLVLTWDSMGPAKWGQAACLFGQTISGPIPFPKPCTPHLHQSMGLCPSPFSIPTPTPQLCLGCGPTFLPQDLCPMSARFPPHLLLAVCSNISFLLRDYHHPCLTPNPKFLSRFSIQPVVMQPLVTRKAVCGFPVVSPSTRHAEAFPSVLSGDCILTESRWA